jgi:phage terminase large subunit-like protein
VITTTAGRGQAGVAWEQYEYARKVALGEIDNPAFLPILFEAPRDCDWLDEDVWFRVNPGLKSGYPNLANLRDLAREAKDRPADRESFRQLHLNIWLDNSTSPFVDMAISDEGAEPIDMQALIGRPCWIGVDLSSTTDLTAVVAAFPEDDGGFTVLPFLFCPADNLKARADRDGVAYPEWAKAGHLEVTPGNVVDYGAVEQRIRSLCQLYDVREIGFDRKFATQIEQPLMADGFNCVDIRQGWVTQSPALNTLERAIVSRKLRHGGHPVLRWNFENVSIHTDSAGNRVMHKGKSTDRIDGAAATWMAVSRAAAGEDNRSFLDNPNITPEMLVLC